MRIHAMKKITSVIMAALLVASFTSCGVSGKSGNVSAPVTVLNTADMFSSKDQEIGYDEASCVKITLSGSSAQAEGDGVTVSGSTVTVTKEGTYLLSGTLEHGAVIVDADQNAKIRLIFNGVKINCDTSAALYVRQADKVFVTLAPGSENTLSNSAAFAAIDDNDIDAVVFSKDDLTFNGNGTLTVNAVYGHGITSKDDLVFSGGTYRVTAEKKGIDANDSIRIADGNFTVTSGTDALHVENTEDTSKGYLYISDGSFTLTAGTDGMDASGAIQIDGGSFTITTGGGSQNASTKQDGSRNGDWGNWGGGQMPGGDMGGGFGQPGGNMDGGRRLSADTDTAASVVTLSSTADLPALPAPGSDDSSRARSNTATATASSSSASDSAKGVKSDNSVAINGGSFTIDSSDDAIHSNNALSVTNGTLQISSGDDGMHADAALSVSGGTIDITKSYEGIEGQTITISGGAIHVTASDDGLNAAGGNDGSSMNGRMGQNQFAAQDGVEIIISGGSLYVSASGDGIDSNGNITISGGETYVSGSTNNGNAAFDYNGSATITGGTLIAASMSGMAQNFGSASTQGAMLVTVSQQQGGSAVTLKNSSGKTLATFTPDKAYDSVLVSTPDVKQGSSYTLVTGSAETTVSMASLITGGGSGMGGMGGQMPGGDMGGGQMPGNGGMNGGANRGNRGGRR